MRFSFEILSKILHCHHPSPQVDLLKHGIPDPSLLTTAASQSSISGPEKDGKDKSHEGGDYMATPIFVHTK